MKIPAALLAALLLALAPLARAADITVDTRQQRQVIHGFGTCIIDWVPDTHKKLYLNPEFQKRYVEDLGNQMVRIPIDPQVLPDEVADAKAISWKNYQFADAPPNIRRPQYAVEWAQAIYKMKPDEIKVFGSVWSPPHWMKEGAKLDRGNTCGGRLRPDRYEHFGYYLANWIIGLKEKYGVPLYAVSLQNELVFKEPYNSCVYKPEEFRDVMKAVGKVFKELKIDTKIMGPEDMTDQVGRFMGFVNAVEKDPEAAPLLDIFCSHGYYGGTISAGTRDENASLWNRLKGFNHELWMTETGGGTAGWDDASAATGGAARPRANAGALNGLAAMMHNALVYGNVSVWTLWQITDSTPDAPSALMYKDQPTKKYYVAKHYSRFIRDGARRVEAAPDGEAGVFVSAYTHEKNRTLTIVLQNRGTDSAALQVSVKSDLKFPAFETYRTSKDEDCKPLDPTHADAANTLALTLPPRCIVTLYAKAD